MRILIVDDSVAATKGLRPLFSAAMSKRRKTGKRNRGAQPGQLVIACTPKKSGGSNVDCACAGLDLADQPEQAAAIFDAMGITLLNRACHDEGSALIELAFEIRLAFFGPDHPATALSRNSRARVRREAGDLLQALTESDDALRINTRVFGRRSLPVAVSLVELGATELLRGEFRKAHRIASRGLQILKSVGLYDSDPNTTRLLDIRGRAELNLGDLAQADATYAELLPIDLRQLKTRDHPKYATHLANAGTVKESLNRFPAAIRSYEHAIAVYADQLKLPCHPNLMDAYANLASLLCVRDKPGDLARAGKLLARVLEIDRRVRGDEHPLVGNDYANLGRHAYDSAGSDKGDAGNYFAKALKIYERNVSSKELPADHFFIAEALTWSGRVQVESEAPEMVEKAEPDLERAIRIWPAQLGPDTAAEAVAKACLGRSFFLQGKEPQRARKLLTEAYPVVLAAWGRSDAFVQQVDRWIQALPPASPSGPLSALRKRIARAK